MRVTIQVQVGEILQRLTAPVGIHLSRERIAA